MKDTHMQLGYTLKNLYITSTFIETITYIHTYLHSRQDLP